MSLIKSVLIASVFTFSCSAFSQTPAAAAPSPAAGAAASPDRIVVSTKNQPKEDGAIQSTMPVDAVQGWLQSPGKAASAAPSPYPTASQPKGEDATQLPTFNTLKQAADAGVNPAARTSPEVEKPVTMTASSFMDLVLENKTGLFAGLIIILGGVAYSAYSRAVEQRQNRTLDEESDTAEE